MASQSNSTSSRLTFLRVGWLILAAVLSLVLGTRASAQPLDETWQVTVNGQTVQVNPDGSFRISNISAADSFGPAGPGTRPDFLSDDFLRLVGTRTVGGVTEYAFSEPFQIRGGQTFTLQNLTFTDQPPPSPERIRLSISDIVLIPGDTAQLTVTGNMADGSLRDLTHRSAWTIYRTSNPAVATVGADGLVSAVSAGPVFITAVNEGATAVLQLLVVIDTVTTTVEGFVQREDGSPVIAAQVTLFSESTLSVEPDGYFAIENALVPGGAATISVTASATIDGQAFRGGSAAISPIADGITDVGIVTLREVSRVLVFGTRPNERAQLGSDLSSLGHDVQVLISLPSDLSEYGAIWHVDAFTPLTSTERLQLADFVNSGRGLYLTGERPCCAALNASVETLLNSLVSGGGLELGGMGDSSGSARFNPNAVGGITTSPNVLTLWHPSGPGVVSGIGSLPDANLLATMIRNEIPVAGAWDCSDLVGGRGRITLLMDVNWLRSDPSRLLAIENIQTFLGNAPGCAP